MIPRLVRGARNKVKKVPYIDQSSIKEGHPDIKPMILQAWESGRRSTISPPPEKKTVSETIDIKEQRRPDEAGFVINGNRTKKGRKVKALGKLNVRLDSL